MRYRVHLTFNNRGGSIEHYYHFVLGYLVPLLNSLVAIDEVGAARRIYLRSCAVFDPLVTELGLPNLTILHRRIHKWLGSFLKSLPVSLSCRCFKIRGFDTPSSYDFQAFQIASQILRETLREKIDQAADAIGRPGARALPLVLLIDRGAPHPYYRSPRRGRKPGAGRDRRSIANMDALEEKLRFAGLNLRAETLEGKSLAFQIALFQSADVIVAQHGAALCNMLWARPSTAILEIVPEGADLTKPLNHFGELAGCLRLPYQRIRQDGRHGPVDVTLVTEVVRQLLRIKLARDGGL